MDKYNKIKQNFFYANEYSNNATVQNLVRKQLLNISLEFVNTPVNNILCLGMRSTSELLELNNMFQPNTLDIVDLALPNLSNSQVYKDKNINLFELNFDQDLHLLTKNYDLIFSNMSFQWSNNLNNLISNLKRKLNNKSLLTFTTLLSGNFHEISNILRVNKMLSKDTTIKIIKDNKLECLYNKSFYLTLRFENFKKLTTHLKNTGVNTYTGSLNKVSFSTIKNLYKQSNDCKLTYHIGLFICYKE
ncbi:biotin synthase [Allofrancisella frigidaquae]|uniref:Biotin synthase n=1 Tax=Allofrancisella frigidaquae TaxID=1085644 RepID=A0A6M3HUE3_9GAMM|nr:biotin synthase [Allofrancisella frigidaquae]QIV94650.1 biotin synthase [Allofrancisella frigidaquae]